MKASRPHKRSQQDLRGIGEELFRSISLIVGLEQLLDNFAAKIREIVDARAVYVVLYEPLSNRYTGRKASGGSEQLLHSLAFSHTDRLVKWLTVNRTVLQVSGGSGPFQFLDPREQELLTGAGIVLAVPLIVVNRLTGIIFLAGKASGSPHDSTEKDAGGLRYQTGKNAGNLLHLTGRNDGSPYLAEEIDFLELLAGQAALAIEHALVHKFQEDQLKRIFRADQLATVGELAAGAAHEIRNPLTSIRSTVQYLRKDLPEDKRNLVDGVIEEVDRIDGIIKGLLSLSRSTELQISRFDLSAVVQQTLSLLEPELKAKGIHLDRPPDPPDTSMSADSRQLKQVLLNLFMNALQAMSSGGKLTVALGDDPLRDGHRGGFLRLTVEDTGTGIPAENLEKVFDPFFTTRESGTGLGLSICYGIVSNHGGEIEISSRTEGPRRGTTVTLHLPREQAVRQPERIPPDQGRAEA